MNPLRARHIVAIVLLSMLGCDRQRPADPVTPAPYDDPRRTARVEAMHSSIADAPGGIVFVGDSITELWTTTGRPFWDEHFAPRGAINLGLGGDRTQNLLWRLRDGRLRALDPHTIVLLIGTNNVADGGHDADRLAAGILAVVDALLHRWPRSRVVTLAMLPRDFDDPDRTTLLEDTNARVRDALRDSPVEFLDLGERFLDEDGTPNRALLPDGVHPDLAGYEVLGTGVLTALTGRNGTDTP